MKKRIEYTKDFIKHFKARISNQTNLEQRVQQRIDLFLEDRFTPILQDHRLTGKLKMYRSFSVTGDCRIIYYEKENNVVFVFVDTGSHNQVY